MTGSGGLLLGRLGLAGSRMTYTDRHGLLWLQRGRLSVENGTLRFVTSGSPDLAEGAYDIPYQGVSMILLGPGTSITHDVFRLMSLHGTLLAAIGDGGVKMYTAPPFGQGKSKLARKQAELWANEKNRLDVARKMYAWRFGEVLPHRQIEVLRGIEGDRIKTAYQREADRFGISWVRRQYDRANPMAADIPNQAINHAATFVESAAGIAVAAVGAIPPLGFIHETASHAFTLDIADLYRSDITIPIAFKAARKALDDPEVQLERVIRYEAAAEFRKQKLIPKMIDRIKELIHADDDDSHPSRQ